MSEGEAQPQEASRAPRRRIVAPAGGPTPPGPPPPSALHDGTRSRSQRAADVLEAQLRLPDEAAQGPALPPWEVQKLVQYKPGLETLAEAPVEGPKPAVRETRKAQKAKAAAAAPAAPRPRVPKPPKGRRHVPPPDEPEAAQDEPEQEPARGKRGSAADAFESVEELLEETLGAQDREGWVDASIPPPAESPYKHEQPVVRVGPVDEDTDPAFDPSEYTAEQLGLPGAEKVPRKPGRQAGSASAAAAPEDVKVRGLEDLLAAFPLGDGQHVLKVERLAPKVWYGQQCAGYQGVVRDVLGADARWGGDAMSDFIDRFGGGEYLLRVYGPPRRVGQSALDPATGLPRPRALSQDVRLTVPWVPPTGAPPKAQQLLPDDDEDDPVLFQFNGDSEDDDYDDDGDEEEEDSMPLQQIPLVRPPRQGATPADARNFETSVTAAQREQDVRRAERRERDESRRREQNEVVPLVIEATQASADRVMEASRAVQESLAAQLAASSRHTEEERRRREEAERQALDERRAEVERERRRVLEEAERDRQARAEEAKNRDPMSTIAQVLNMVQPQGQAALQSQLDVLKTQLTAATAEHTRLQQAHEQERARLDEARRQEVQREREVKEREIEYLRKGFEAQLNAERDRIKNESERAERRARDAEDRAELRVRDAEERSARAVREAEEKVERTRREAQAETDRRLAELQRIFELTKGSDDRSHERELRALQATYDGQIKVTSTVGDTQLKVLQQQLAEAKAEMKRLREQLDNAPDPLEKLQEIREQGMALGLQEKAPDKEPDWKQHAFQLVGGVVQQLPAIFGEVQKLRSTPTAAQAAQTQMMMQQQRPQLPPQQMMMGPQGPVPQPRMLPPSARRAELPPPLPFGVEGASVLMAPQPTQWSAVQVQAAQPPVLAQPQMAMPQMLQQMVAPPPQPQQPQFAPNPAPQQPVPQQAQPQYPADFGVQPAPTPQAPMPAQPPTPAPLPAQQLLLPATEPPLPAGVGEQEMHEGPQNEPFDELPPEVSFAEPAPEVDAASAQMIAKYMGILRPRFEGAFMQNAPASVFVAELRDGLGPVLPQAAAMLSVEGITDSLLSQPDGARSPLLTARGQDWLADVLKEAQR